MARRFSGFLVALIVLVGVGGLPSATSAGSSAALDRILEQGTLRVGMTGTQPPLNFVNKTGAHRGLEVDLAQAVAALMGVELQVVTHPFGKLLGALEGGEVDLVMSGMTITAPRSAKAAFVGPYFLSGKSILTTSSQLAQAEEAGALDQPDLTLVALGGSTSEAFVKARAPKAKLVTTEDYDQAVAMVLEGKAGALVADREIVALTAFLNPKAGLATLRQPLTIEPIGLAIQAGDPLFEIYLRNALSSLEASGVLNALRSRWVERSDWVTELP